MAPDDLHIVTSGGCPPTPEEAARNEPLLAGYDYSKYPEGITGFNGMNLQRITACRSHPAVRVRVGPRGNYKGAICRLDDGTLRLAVCRRINETGLFGIHIYASRDKGLRWEEIGTTKLFGKEMSLTAVRDGSLLMTAQDNGYVSSPTRLLLYRSEDRGRTWETFGTDGPGAPRNVVIEPDGSLLRIRERCSAHWKHLYARANIPFSPSPNFELLRSTDGGRTWERREGRVDWDHTAFGCFSVVRLPGGKLLTAFRSNPPGTAHEAREVTCLSESTDDGATWSKPRVMSNNAEVQANLLLLSSGRLLATYTNYHLPFGVCAVVSDDHGKTWSYDVPIQLALSADTFTGWPVTVELDNGELITSYAITAYLNEPPAPPGAPRSACEVVRWRIPDA